MKSRLLIAVLIGAALVAAPFVIPETPDQELPSFKNPYSDPYELVKGIYDADHWSLTGSELTVKGVIVPHHLVASQSMALGIRALVEHKPRHIVLLAPDHFDQCPTVLCTTDGIFHTEFGDVQTDAIESDLVTKQSNLFIREHGIFSVVPFIANYLPGVRITPIVLSQKHGWKAYKDQLLSVIRDAVGDGALVVSSDFSHYLPVAEADQKDVLTEWALMSFDMETIEDVDNPSQSDCPGCLWLMAALMKEQSVSPEILLHTNAARILGDLSVQETTSHYSIVYR